MELTRRNVCAGILLLGCSGPARAEGGSAKAFLEGIYDRFKGPDSRGIAYQDRAGARRYFVPALAALIVKDLDAAAKRREIGRLNFDPFIQGNDWVISDVAITATERGDKAAAVATFKNHGNPTQVTYDLVRLAGGWRITDMRWAGNTLRRQLSGR